MFAENQKKLAEIERLPEFPGRTSTDTARLIEEIIQGIGPTSTDGWSRFTGRIAKMQTRALRDVQSYLTRAEGIFFGAGTTAPATCALWRGLLDALGKEARRSNKRLPEDWHNKDSLDQAQDIENALGRYRMLMVVRAKLMQHGIWPAKHCEALVSAVGAKRFISTNFDPFLPLLLEQLGKPYSLLATDQDLTKKAFAPLHSEHDRLRVVFMHGEIGFGNICLTRNDYARFQASEGALVRECKRLADQHLILFHGTGLADVNIDQVFGRANGQDHNGLALLVGDGKNVAGGLRRALKIVRFGDRQEMTDALSKHCERVANSGHSRPFSSYFEDSTEIASTLARSSLENAIKILDQIDQESHKTSSSQKGRRTRLMDLIINTRLGPQAVTTILKSAFDSLRTHYTLDHFKEPSELYALAETFSRISHTLLLFQEPVVATKAMEIAWQILPYGHRGAIPERLGRRYAAIGMYREAIDRFKEGMREARFSSACDSDSIARLLLRCLRRGMQYVQELSTQYINGMLPDSKLCAAFGMESHILDFAPYILRAATLVSTDPDIADRKQKMLIELGQYVKKYLESNIYDASLRPFITQLFVSTQRLVNEPGDLNTTRTEESVKLAEIAQAISNTLPAEYAAIVAKCAREVAPAADKWTRTLEAVAAYSTAGLSLPAEFVMDDLNDCRKRLAGCDDNIEKISRCARDLNRSFLGVSQIVDVFTASSASVAQVYADWIDLLMQLKLGAKSGSLIELRNLAAIKARLTDFSGH